MDISEKTFYLHIMFMLLTINIQIAFKMIEQFTLVREYKSLLKIKDNYPKYALTMVKTWNDAIECIEHKHIVAFY